MNISPYTQPATIEAAIKAASAVGAAERWPCPALSEATRLRLVKGSQCPTRQKSDAEARKRWFEQRPVELFAASLDTVAVTDRQGVEKYRVGSERNLLPEYVEQGGQKISVDHMVTTGEVVPDRSHQSKGPGRFTVITHREWSNEYRIRTEVEAASGSAPVPTAGDRITDRLTMTGARAIADSCNFMALQKGGYTTFLTLTLNARARERLTRRVVALDMSGPRLLAGDRRATGRGAEYVDELPGEQRAEYTPVRFAGDWCNGIRAAGRFTPVCFPWESSLQKEVSRFFDAAQKMYQRGWKATKVYSERQYPWGNVGCLNPRKKPIQVSPSPVVEIDGPMARERREYPGGSVECVEPFSYRREKLHYAWVAEAPENAMGEANPHVHVLMKWQVPKHLFREWADRLEKLWGLGFAHLEKIKAPEKAGAYMAKAAGYMTKGEDGFQGRIRGNRYGISSASRAPAWAEVGRYEMGIMGSLITDTHDYFTHLYGQHFQERQQLNEKLAELPKGAPERHSIGERLEKVRATLNALPAIASKHQIVLRGEKAYREFIAWARDPLCLHRADWLPAKGQGEFWSDAGRPDSAWLAKFYHNLKHRRWSRHTGGASWWDSVCEWARRWEPVSNNDTPWERQNWGFI